MLKLAYHLGKILERIDVAWCRAFHKGIYWSGGNHYTCVECLKKYAVPWAQIDKLDKDVYINTNPSGEI